MEKLLFKSVAHKKMRLATFFSAGFGQYLESGDFGDVVLEAAEGGERFVAHQLVLAYSSAHFARLLLPPPSKSGNWGLPSSLTSPGTHPRSLHSSGPVLPDGPSAAPALVGVGNDLHKTTKLTKKKKKQEKNKEREKGKEHRERGRREPEGVRPGGRRRRRTRKRQRRRAAQGREKAIAAIMQREPASAKPIPPPPAPPLLPRPALLAAMARPTAKAALMQVVAPEGWSRRYPRRHRLP